MSDKDYKFSEHMLYFWIFGVIIFIVIFLASYTTQYQIKQSCINSGGEPVNEKGKISCLYSIK